jgi:hypothetical protein
VVALGSVACDCDSAVEGYHNQKKSVEKGVESGVPFLESRENCCPAF